MINPDIFGYYTVGDFRTYRKLEAIEAHVKTGIHPTWVFNDTVYSAIDWTTEPEPTLEQLYAQRAQQLRENYDYLVLWYSGGADSDAVLNAFIDNGILIDEVVSFVNYAATHDQHDFCNGEIFNVAGPKIKQIQKSYPKLKHRIVDMCQPMMDFFRNDSLNDHWIYDLNSITTGFAAAKQHIYNYVPDWQLLFERGKKVGFISGTDKPRMQQTSDGHYHFKFVDIFDRELSAGMQTANHEWFHHEFFFWSPDSPLIVVKQSHVIKKYLKHATATDPMLTDKSNGLAYKNINGQQCWLKVDAVHKLIYPGWQPIPYQMKDTSPIIGQRENWFRALGDSDPAVKVYKAGMLKRWQSVPDYWKNGRLMPQGYKSCTSKSYDLGS